MIPLRLHRFFHLGALLLAFLHLVPGADAIPSESSNIPFGTAQFWIYIGLIVVLVLFGGLCSGLSMGLLSQETLHLEVLSKSDDATVSKHATGVLQLARHRHLVLVTLLLANSAAMEALPLFLDRLTLAYIAIIISVTVVLLFGEILPSAICSKYGLAIGYHLRYVVWALMFVSLPLAWPVAKGLDWMLGADHNTYYRRSELKHFVVAHGQAQAEGTHGSPECGLTEQETQIISGAIDLQDKTVSDSMQPIHKVFMVDADRVLDLPTLMELVHVGHSRIPVYEGAKDNIIGLLRVKHLIIVNPSIPTTVKQQKLFPIPRVSADRPLYDMLQYFRTGRSHMVLVEENPGGPVLGIITLEDLIEELLQAEIKAEEEEIVFMRSKSTNRLMRGPSLRLLRQASRAKLGASTHSLLTNPAGGAGPVSIGAGVKPAPVQRQESMSVPINEETPLVNSVSRPPESYGRHRAVSFFA